MSSVPVVPLTVICGATQRQQFRYGQPTQAAVLVVDIANASPAVVTTLEPHGLPAGTPWPVQIVSERCQTVDARHRPATVLSSTTLSLPLSTLLAPAFRGPAELRYFPPVDLTDYTARMQVRESSESSVVLLELTTENGGLDVEPHGSVTLLLTEAQTTAAVAWGAAVYDIELVSPSGDVTRLCKGPVTVDPNTTRED